MKPLKKELQDKSRFALKEYKEEHNLTQEDMAREFGVSRVTIGNWLIGRHNISSPMLKLFQMKGIL